MERDLHKRHGPVTDMFPRLAEPAPWRLSDDQVAAFERDGFVSGIKVFDEAQVAALCDRLERLRTQVGELGDDLYEVEAAWTEDPDSVVFHFLGAWMVDELFHDLVWHPAITVPSAQLLGVERLRFWHDQVFYKPPRHSGVVPWHQDYSYWTRTGPPRHITVNVVLDDTNLENGCLHFVPGSHRWPLLPKVPFDGPMDALLADVPGKLRDGFRPVPVPLRAGEASIHHSHTVHGSFANQSDGPRRAVVVNTMAADTRVAHGSAPLLKGVPMEPEGSVVAGDHFPILI